jgi:hypothetical protein
VIYFFSPVKNTVTWVKVDLRVTFTEPALKWPKRKTLLSRGSTNTSHHKKCDHRKTWIIIRRKILHITGSIIIMKNER